MRITQRAVALTSLQGLNRNLDAVGKLQQQQLQDVDPLFVLMY